MAQSAESSWSAGEDHGLPLINHVRRRRGLSIYGVGKQMGYSPQTVEEWQKGTRPVPLTAWMALNEISNWKPPLDALADWAARFHGAMVTSTGWHETGTRPRRKRPDATSQALAERRLHRLQHQPRICLIPNRFAQLYSLNNRSFT